jgi:predicted transcriptional regulator
VARTHVVLDDDVLRAVDEVAGERGRSRFLEEAAREKLARLALESALSDTAGVLDEEDYPQFATRERTAEWVRAMRGTEPAA